MFQKVHLSTINFFQFDKSSTYFRASDKVKVRLQHPLYLGLEVEGEQLGGDGGHVGVDGGGGAPARAQFVDLLRVL